MIELCSMSKGDRYHGEINEKGREAGNTCQNVKVDGKASPTLAQKPKGERVARSVLEEEQSRQRDQPVQRL